MSIFIFCERENKSQVTEETFNGSLIFNINIKLATSQHFILHGTELIRVIQDWSNYYH